MSTLYAGMPAAEAILAAADAPWGTPVSWMDGGFDAAVLVAV